MTDAPRRDTPRRDTQPRDSRRGESIQDWLSADVVVPGTVHRLDGYAVGHDGTSRFAVSRRCRHQLADLSEGKIDADGCLVCPWHGSRYDTQTGEMVEGPRGFLGYHGRTPGYTHVVLALGRRWRLRTRRVVERAGRVFLG
jgi:nitrite reductase/ring-hydroxylating ferredoxin subunit